MKLVSVIFISLVFLYFLPSCTRDVVMEVENECVETITYDDHVRAIVNANCSYSGCHSGSAPGDFTNFEGISSYFEGDELERRVIIRRDMPPNYALGPRELSEGDLELFKCWIDGGYQEN